MDKHKSTCLDICSRHLARNREEGNNFQQQIITGDETWVHPYQPETTWKSMQWKHPLSPVAKKFQTQPLSGKFMLSIFWDFQGHILETYFESGKTVTSATYCDMLQRRLKPPIRSRRRV
jgi:hypothetical protein